MTRYTPPSTPERLAQRERARAAKLDELHTVLAEQVAALRDGQDWQRWLATAARLPHYSLNNLLLIAAQRPQATAVAGFHAWKALGRRVDKGEKGIAILAPVVRRPRPGADSQQDAGAADRVPGRSTDDGGEAYPREGGPAKEDVTGIPSADGRISGFTVAYVFDVSQTSGEPLPQQPSPTLLAGQAPAGLWDVLAEQVTSRGFALLRAHGGPGVNGLTHYGQRTVTVRPDVDDAQAVKTLAHELAHVLLHDPTGPDTQPSAGVLTSVLLCRGRVEVEAESVAYLIAASHGLHTGSYTFPYVAGWASSIDVAAAANPDTVVRDTAQRVLTAARTVLAACDAPSTGHADSEGLVRAEHTTVLPATLQADALLGTATTADLLSTATNTKQAARQATLRSPGRVGAQRVAADQASRPHPSGRSSSLRPQAVQADRLLQAHELAVSFYTAWLHTSREGHGARALLTTRGLDAVIARQARLGYASHGWTRLLTHLRTAGFSDSELLASGLAIRSSRGTLIDRFRDRIVFPITDHSNRTVALIGRAVSESTTDIRGSAVPKYLNSPDTDLYRKGDVLYGLGEARTALSAGALPVLVEGPMDVLAVNLASARARAAGSAGPALVGVAPCGTALTASQVNLLDHATGGLADRGVVVAFDGDDAGRQASVRAYALLREVNAWPQAADLPPGQDPAEVLLTRGAAGLHAALRCASRPLADLVIDERIDRYTDQLRWPEGRLAAGRSAAAVIVTLPPDQVSHQVIRLVDRLQLPASVISGMITDAVTDPKRTPTVLTQQTTAEQRPGANAPAVPGSNLTSASAEPGSRALSAVERARAGYPSPLTVTAVLAQPPGRRPVTIPTGPTLRRHA